VKVLISDALAAPGVEFLKDQGLEVDELLDLSPDELRERIKEYDGLIIRSGTKVTSDIIEAADNLRAIGRAGIGVDNIDVEAASKRGILVANAPESNTIAAAEHTVGLMLSAARRISAADSSMRAGEWKRGGFKGVELAYKTLGLIGLGHVGSIVARIANGFRMRVLAYDPYVSAERMRTMNVYRAESLEEIYEKADFISPHVPSTPQTTGMIGEEAIAKMKPTTYVINASRGGIIDETALYDALKEERLAGAALDVFEEEPPEDSPLLKLENFVSTPHLGASTVEAQDRAGRIAAEQVAVALESSVPMNAINAPVPEGEGAEFVANFSRLCEALGMLIYRLTERPGERLKIEYQGDIAGYDTRLLDISVQKGLLSPMVNEPLNYVNTPTLAGDRGLKVETTSTTEGGAYTSLITARLQVDSQENLVSGTLIGPQRQPRIIEILGHEVDIVLEKHMLFIRYDDIPGVIGRVGTILGENSINIGNMAVGRDDPVSKSIMALTVDDPVPETVLDQLLEIPNCTGAYAVDL